MEQLEPLTSLCSKYNPKLEPLSQYEFEVQEGRLDSLTEADRDIEITISKEPNTCHTSSSTMHFLSLWKYSHLQKFRSWHPRHLWND